jgi:hypothetical protein
VNFITPLSVSMATTSPLMTRPVQSIANGVLAGFVVEISL